MTEMMEEVGDLSGSDAAQRKRWKIVLSKELGASCLVAIFWSATDDFGKKEELVGVEGVRRMAVEVTVEKGGEFADADFVAGFFASFPNGGNGGRLADICPATRECPTAVREFADQKNAFALESSDTNIDLGSGVTELPGEKLFQRIRV